ncbi:MAG: hypothetical protein ABI835_13125 [Chloroflexota bacterium]
MKRFALKGPALGCLVVGIAVILCSGVSMFTVDRLCYGNLSQRLPIYTNAEVVRRVHNLFTEFGMGNTVITLISPDDPDTVRSWYAVHTGSYLREALRNNTPFFRMSQGQVDVSHDPDNPSGSQIILFGTCVN